MAGLLLWLQQPTSVAGVSALVGTLFAMMTQQIAWPQAVPLLAGALVSIAIPDNTSAKGAAETLARDVVSEISAPTAIHQESK
jgi:hypothetical protein